MLPAGWTLLGGHLQPDPHAAARFYGALLGWSFDEPAPMPGGIGGHYVVARVDGRPVAGIGQASDPESPAVWATHVAVSDLERALVAVGHAGGALVTGPLEAVPEAPFALWRLPGYEGGEPEQPMPRDVVAVATPTDPAAVPPHWAVNFRVEDTDATADHAVALGGTVRMAPTDTPGFRSAVIGDPHGDVIAVSAAAAAR